jgi:DNA-binding response OmpR family regulator
MAWHERLFLWLLIAISYHLRSEGFIIRDRNVLKFRKSHSYCPQFFGGRSTLLIEPPFLPRLAVAANKADDTSSSGKGAMEDYNRVQDKEFLERTKRWVVLVDDEEAIRMSVGDYLYDSGYRVTACADADAMLEVCAKPQTNGELPAIPDVIVSDVRMPGKDGLELVGLIRADERLERVPIILLSAKGLTSDRIAGYKAGADVYLPKPFSPEELLSIIDNAILRRQQMTGEKGQIVELKEDLSNIKQLLRKNGSRVVKATDVYLTPAEREVLDLLCKGYTNGEIAAERGVNVLGINRTIQKMYLATQTRTRTELVRWAISTGYVSRR